jgi:HK97 family phage prohead protease
MPWHVDNNHPDCSGYAVVKDGTGEVEGCHDTREAANKQLAALYANEPEAGRAQMAAAKINDLPDSAFAYIEPGGKKDDQGKTVPRSKRHFPIHDAAHVRNALARAPQSPFGDKAMPKIKAAAKKMGIGEPAEKARSDMFAGPQLFVRSYPLEDIRILSRAQGSEYADGRTVEAYAAVFDSESEIHDGEGHYMEVIDRTAFNRAIEHARPQGSRTAWRTGVFYNHGMTLHGTPSDRFSVPLGSPVDMRVENHGLLTVTRYNNTTLADEILESIRSGDITGHSFTGRIIRSDPSRPARGYRPTARGSLPKVRRLELGLREYGPTPFPAYVDAAVVGVRSMLAAALPAFLSTTHATMVDEFAEDGDEPDEAGRSDIDDPVDSDTSSDEELVPDDSPSGHSSRDPEMARHAIMQQIAAARRTRPGLAQKEKPS